MKRKFVISLILLSNLVVFGTHASAQSRRESEVFDLINQQRARARLSRLAWDDRLGEIAREYSRKMAREGFFDHFDRAGKTVKDRALEAHVKNWKEIGENLFACEASPSFVTLAVDGWMKSPTHRENILYSSWTATGIGVATARDGSIFVTQVFTR